MYTALSLRSTYLGLDCSVQSTYYWYTEITPHWQTRILPGVDPEPDQRVQNIRHSNYTHESNGVHIRMPLIDNALGRLSPSWLVADYC